MLALSSVNINKYLFVVGSDVFVKSKGGESERIMVTLGLYGTTFFISDFHDYTVSPSISVSSKK